MGVYAITTSNETPLLYNAVHMNARRRVHTPITISTCFACSKIDRLRLDKFQLQFHPFPLRSIHRSISIDMYSCSILRERIDIKFSFRKIILVLLLTYRYHHR